MGLEEYVLKIIVMFTFLPFFPSLCLIFSNFFDLDYLSTDTASMRVAQFRENPKACLYFTDSRFFRGVMLLGTVEVMEDAEHKEMIWESGDTIYYPRIRDNIRIL